MVYFKNSKEFVRCNEKELRVRIARMCYKYRVSERYIGDITQNIFLRIIDRGVMENLYRPDGPSSIDTYIYSMIRNTILNHLQNQKKLKEVQVDFYSDLYTDNGRYLEGSYIYAYISTDYQNLLERNRISDAPDGINKELEDFEIKYSKGSGRKRYLLRRRKKCRNILGGCSRSDVYRYIKLGYKNRDIADIYGVSKMFVSIIKKEIQIAMKDYGFNYPIKRKRGRRKKELA